MPSQRASLVFVLVVVVLAFTSPIQVSQAQSWRDKLREKTESVRDKAKDIKSDWQRSAKNCSSCGKKIHGRSVCFTCQTKRSSRRVDELKENWRNSAQPCSVCGKKVHGRRTCFTCQSRRAIHKNRPKLQRAWKEAQSWASERSRVLKRHAAAAAREYGPRVRNAVRDPENQRKALEAIGALHSAHVQLQDMRYKATYQGLKLAGQIPIDTEKLGRATLESVARQRLLDEYPYLAGTPLVDDPAAPLAHLFTGDRSYFFAEMPLVESRGRKVSLKDALVESNRLDSKKTIQFLAVLEAAEDVSHTLDTGEGTLAALGSTLNAIEAIRGD